MTQQFIGFLRNAATREEFMCPVAADTRAEAQMLLEMDYPTPAYALCTIYARSELNQALSSIDRWPGLPSKVQPHKPRLDETLARVTAHQGNLPPLTKAAPAAMPQADGARIDMLKDFIAQQSPQVQELAARLVGTPKLATPKPAVAPAKAAPKPVAAVPANVPAASAIAAIKALHSLKAGTQPQAAAPMAAPPVRRATATAATPAAPVAATTGAPAKGSLIAALKAMKA